MTEETYIDVHIAKFLTGGATPEEAMLLEDWKARSADNLRYFDQCCTLFNHPVLTITKEEHIDAWEKIKVGLQNHKRPWTNRIYKWTGGVAASLILLGTMTWLLYRTGTKDTPVSNASNVYAAGISSRKVDLGSSVVLLSPGATLTVAGEGRMRLKGSAFFAVQHDSLHPIVIQAGELFVRDIGTRFTISSSPGEASIMVSVHEGEVFLYDNHGAAVNTYAGEQAVYVAATKKLEIIRREKEIPTNREPNKESKTAPMPADSANGSVVFDCKGCATRGQLVFIRENAKDTIKTNATFYRTWDPDIVRHIELMKPGKYKWEYSDARGMNKSGKLTVTSNSEHVVRLPEP